MSGCASLREVGRRKSVATYAEHARARQTEYVSGMESCIAQYEERERAISARFEERKRRCESWRRFWRLGLAWAGVLRWFATVWARLLRQSRIVRLGAVRATGTRWAGSVQLTQRLSTGTISLVCRMGELSRRSVELVLEIARPYCPEAQPIPLSEDDFLVIGHRGSPSREVENTIESFEAALEEGANGLEIDACLTADEEVVLWHDWDPDHDSAVVRQAGLERGLRFRPRAPLGGPYRAPVHRLPLAVFRRHYGYAEKGRLPIPVDAHIPTLSEFLEWARARQELRLVVVNLRVPEEENGVTAALVRRVQTQLYAHTISFNVVYRTTSAAVLDAIRETEPAATCALDVEVRAGLVFDVDRWSGAQRAVEQKTTFASVSRPGTFRLAPWISYRRIVEHDVRLCATHNRITSSDREIKKLIAGTVNEQREMRCLMVMGVPALSTTRPGTLRLVAESVWREAEEARKAAEAAEAERRALALRKAAEKEAKEREAEEEEAEEREPEEREAEERQDQAAK